MDTNSWSLFVFLGKAINDVLGQTNREFMKLRRPRRGQRQLNNDFIFYLRISCYFKVI